MALSARHLSCIAHFDTLIADHYYHQCLKSLIPALSDSRAILDENIFASTVILRLLEEFEVSVVGSDRQSHLLGSQSLSRAQESIGIEHSGLRQAVSWACLRQEIYTSLIHQRSVQLNLRRYSDALSKEAEVDSVWARQMIVLCAKAIQFSFGPFGPSQLAFEELQACCTDFENSRPLSSRAFYVSENDRLESGEIPEMKYLSDWAVMGTQYYLLANLLLLAHNPGLPRVGPSRKSAIEQMDRKIRSILWEMCGVALSNLFVPPAMLVTCMAIALCGDRFLDKISQGVLLDILIETDKRLGWPTGTIRTQLLTTWSLH